jgi:hypothetical protein
LYSLCYCFTFLGGVVIADMPQPRGFNEKRLTIADKFLQPTIPTGNENFYNMVRQTIGKELSVANLQREDIPSYVLGTECAQTFLIKGLDMRARRIMNTIVSELKLSMSIDAEFAHLLFKDTLEYTQTQNVHEYVHQPVKKGFLGLGGGSQ